MYPFVQMQIALFVERTNWLNISADYENLIGR